MYCTWFSWKCTVFILFYSFLVSVIVCVRVFFECPPKPPNKHVLPRECTFSHRVYCACGLKTNNMNNNLNDLALCLCKMDIDGPSPKVITSYIWSYISYAVWRSRRNFRRKVIALQSKPFSSTQSVSFGKSSLAWSWSPRIVGGANRARLAQGANPAIQEIVQFGHLKHPTILNNFKCEFIYTAITTCVTLKHHSSFRFVPLLASEDVHWTLCCKRFFNQKKHPDGFSFTSAEVAGVLTFGMNFGYDSGPKTGLWLSKRSFIGHAEQLNKLLGHCCFFYDF